MTTQGRGRTAGAGGTSVPRRAPWLLVLLLLLAAPRARAGEPPTLLPGQQAWGLLLTTDELDLWRLDGLAGATLDVTVKGDKKAGVLPTVVLQDLTTDEQVVPGEKQLKGAGGPTVKLSKLVLPSTGTYELRLGTQGAAGSYRIKLKLVLPGKGKTQQVLALGAGGSGVVLFDAPAGAQARITLKPGEGSFVNGLQGPGGFVPVVQVVKGKQRLLTDPEGDPLVLPDAGSYALQVSNLSGAALDVGVSIKLKPAKLAKQDKTTGELLGTIAFAQAASVTAGEKVPGKGHPVSLVVSLPEGAVLPAKVTVPLADAGTGTATSDADYKALSKAKVVLPKGTADGAVVTAYVKLKDDKLPEGDETVALALGQPTLFLEPAEGSAHLLTISEDDPLVQLQVRLGAADGPDVAPGSVIDLGSAPVWGQAAPVLLALTNEGTAPVTVVPPRVPAAQQDFLVDEVFTLNAAPPADPAAGWDPAAEASVALPPAGPDPSGAGVPRLPPVDLDLSAAVRELVLLDLPLPGGGSTHLELSRRPVPFAPDARLTVDGAPVPGGPAALLGDLSVWSGREAGRPETRALLVAFRGGFSGWLERPEGRLHLVPAPLPGAGWERQHTAVLDEPLARALGLEPPPYACQTPLLPPGGDSPDDGAQPGGVGGDGPAPPLGGGGDVLPFSSPDGLPYQCRMALETDTELAALFGADAGALTGYVASLFAGLSELYERSLNVRFSVESLGIHLSGDPWTGTTAGERLGEFQSAWADDWPADADLAHMLSGAALGGGVAYLDVLCHQTWGFGVSGNLTGQATNPGGSGTPLAWDILVTAHEIGHNVGAPHTHDLCPTPVDNCASAEGSPGPCQVLFSVCQLGTIMSYCHTCGGLGSIELDFHPQILDLLLDGLDGSCLRAPILLEPGEVLGYSLTFAPKGGSGQLGEVLTIEHDAFDQPQPFTANLSGVVQD